MRDTGTGERVEGSPSRALGWGLAFGAASVAGSVFMWGFVVDDAFIPIRYARHIAEGVGYRWNVGGAITDGVTPLPWAWLIAPLAHASAWDVLVRVKLLGVLLHAIALAALGWRIAKLKTPPIHQVVALLLVGACLPVAAWSVGGLETPLATFFATLACIQNAPLTIAVLAGAAAALRPELLPWAVVLAGGMAWARPPRSPARAIAAVLVATVPFAVCAILRLVWFGRAAPLSILAKPSDAIHGGMYVVAGLLAAATPLTLIAPIALRRAPAEAKILAAAFVVHALAVGAAGGDWMPYGRLFAPVLPSVALVYVYTAANSPKTSLVRAALALSLAAYVWISASGLGRHVMQDRLDLVNRAKPILAGSTKIAAVDIGWISAATDKGIVDLAGLTDPDFAALPGGHTSKRVDVAMLLDRHVDTLVLFTNPAPLEATEWQTASYGHASGWRLARDPATASHFTGHAVLAIGHTGAGYVVLTRFEAAP